MTTQKRRPLGRDGASQTHRAAATETLPGDADERAPEAFLAEQLRLAAPHGPAPLFECPETPAQPAFEAFELANSYESSARLYLMLAHVALVNAARRAGATEAEARAALEALRRRLHAEAAAWFPWLGAS